MKTKFFFVITAMAVMIISGLQKANAQSWLLSGNNDANNSSKLGTKKDFPLIIYTHNIEQMRIDQTGNVGIGTASPTEKLHIKGTNPGIMLGSSSIKQLGANLIINAPLGSDPPPGDLILQTKLSGPLFAGKVGIGTTTPLQKFHVVGASILANNTTINPSTSPNTVIAGAIHDGSGWAVTSGVGGKASTGQAWGIGSIGSNLYFGFSNGTSDNTMQTGIQITGSRNVLLSPGNQGNVGIGLANPSHSKLEVYGSVGASAGMFRSSGSDSLGVSIHGYFPEIGLNYYYNNGTKTIGKGYAAVMALDPNTGDWYVGNFNGNQSNKAFGDITGFQKPLTITQVGNIGVGLEPINNTSGFNDARLQVGNDGDDNLRLVAADNINDWSMFSWNGTSGALQLYKNGSFRGSFDATTGAYSSFSAAFSDEKLKKDITVLPNIMKKLMKLQPKEYHFKEDTLATKYSYGFIAQEVSKVFPECVTAVKDRRTGEDIFTVNNNNLSVIAIKAIQELSSQNDDKKQEIDSLKQSNQLLNNKLNALSDKINQIENAMSHCCSSFSSNMQSITSNQSQTKATDAPRLDQNTPNPFNNSSSISYYIPSGSHTAQLMITDASGKVLKTYTLMSGAGKQIISGNELTGGMYQYSLLIDGKIVNTKKMALVK